jgi:hypothetical protein
MDMNIFKKAKPGVYLVLAFVIAFVMMRSCEAEAAEGTIELGPTYTSEFNGGAGLVYTERLGKHWDVGLMLMSPQQWEQVPTVDTNGGVMVQRIVTYKKLEMGLGAAGWINTSRLVGCHVGFALSIRYNFSPRVPLTIRHWSNAGSCERNRGQDLLTIGWRFK